MAARTGDEGVARMSDPVLDLRLEQLELAAIEAESIGWQPLGDGAYLHVGDPEESTNKRTPTLFNIKSVMR